jgi:hypothetical protein
MLGLGGFHVGSLSDRDAQALIEAAIDGAFGSLILRNNTKMAEVKRNMDDFSPPNIETTFFS